MNENTENLENFEGLAMYPLQPGEVFKTMSGTDNTYAVSNKGRIFNCRKRRFVQPSCDSGGGGRAADPPLCPIAGRGAVKNFSATRN